MSSGLSHVTFIVRDLERMDTILTEVLGAVRVYDSGASTFSLSPERFYLVGPEMSATWVATMEGESDLPRTYNHVAFQVEQEDLDDLRATVVRLGLELLPPRSRVGGEGESIYFYDDDGHLFELHTGSLRERLAAYRTSPPGAAPSSDGSTSSGAAS